MSEPDERYEPYENGTCHHTRVISKSILMGEVSVEGGGIYLTANGYNTQHLKNNYIGQNYSFIIDPADGLYTFVFENTDSNIQSSIRFVLKERWLDIISLLPALIILLIPASTGIVLFVLGLRGKPNKINSDLLRIKVKYSNYVPV